MVRKERHIAGDPEPFQERDVTVRLIEIPRGKRSRHGPHVTATMELAWREPPRIRGSIPKEITMRNTFNIELSIDIMSGDEERHKAFVELVTHAARTMYGQAAMLAGKRPPRLRVVSIGADGKVDHNVFEGDAFVNEDSE